MKTKLVVLLLVLLLTACAPATPPCGSDVYCGICDGWGENCTCVTAPSVFVYQLMQCMTEASAGQVSYWLCGP